MHNGAIKLYYAYGVYCLEQAALCGGGAVLRKVLARRARRGGARGGAVCVAEEVPKRARRLALKTKMGMLFRARMKMRVFRTPAPC